jgi:hypothetical protein
MPKVNITANGKPETRTCRFSYYCPGCEKTFWVPGDGEKVDHICPGPMNEPPQRRQMREAIEWCQRNGTLIIDESRHTIQLGHDGAKITYKLLDQLDLLEAACHAAQQNIVDHYRLEIMDAEERAMGV